MEFAAAGRRGPTPYEVLLHAAMLGDSTRFTRQDGVEETWRVMQPLLDSPPPGAAVRAGDVGPGGRRPARRRPRRLARPVGGVMSTAAATASRDRRARAERGGAVAVPADRRLRVPVGLPHRRAGRARRRDRLAVRAALRLAERVRHAARPRGRHVPARAVRDQRPGRARLRAGHEHAGHDLEDADAAGSWSATR